MQMPTRSAPGEQPTPASRGLVRPLGMHLTAPRPWFGREKLESVARLLHQKPTKKLGRALTKTVIRHLAI